MRIVGARSALCLAITAGLTVAVLSGCTSGGGKDQGPTPATSQSQGAGQPSDQPSGQSGGDAAIAKREAADLPGGFPDACLLLTTADITKAIHVIQEPQGDTVGKGDKAISVCSYTDGAGTTVIVRTGLADLYSTEIAAGDKITHATNSAVASIGDAARSSVGETAPGLDMAVFTVRKGTKYVQVIACVDGSTRDQLSTIASQLVTLATSRL